MKIMDSIIKSILGFLPYLGVILFLIIIIALIRAAIYEKKINKLHLELNKGIEQEKNGVPLWELLMEESVI